MWKAEKHSYPDSCQWGVIFRIDALYPSLLTETSINTTCTNVIKTFMYILLYLAERFIQTPITSRNKEDLFAAGCVFSK